MEEELDDLNVKSIYESMMSRIDEHKEEKYMKKAHNSYMAWLKWYLSITF